MSPSILHASCNVRPTRIAFALQEPDEAALREIFQLNSTLWGGIFNPIFIIDGSSRVVVGQQENIATKEYQDELLVMLKEFDPDIIITYTGEKLPPKLKPFEHRTFPKTSLIWNPWGDREVPYFLEIWGFLEDLWGKEYKFRIKKEHRFKYLEPNENTENLTYLLAHFGAFPSSSKGNAFLRNLFDAEPLVYDKSFREQYSMGELFFPASLTTLRTSAEPAGALFNYAILLLDPTKVFDLVDYWNLRATGRFVFALPVQEYKDFEKGVLNFADAAYYPINPNVMNHAKLIKARSIPDETLKEVHQWMIGLKVKEMVAQGWFPRFGDGTYRIAPEIEVSPVRSRVSSEIIVTDKGFGTLQGYGPDCEFSRDARSQHWSAELDFYDHSDNDHCYRLPRLLKSGDEAANHAIGHGYDITQSRVTKRGIATIQEGEGRNIPIWPLNVQDALAAVLKDSQIKFTKLSPPGLAAEKLIEDLGGIHGCQVFQNRGVRKIIDRLSNGSHMLASEARGMLYRETDRGDRKNIVPNVLDLLCEKRMLKSGMEFQCSRCKRWEWYHVSSFDDHFTCQRCFTSQNTPRLDEEEWRYRADGLFLLKNKLEGCITVLLALHFFGLYFHTSINYVPSFEYTDDKSEGELDFAIFLGGLFQNDVDFILGEAKTGMQLDGDKKNKLTAVIKRTGAIAAFCTLAPDFSDEDKEYFKQLIGEGARVILLTGSHLEMPYVEVSRYKSKHRGPSSPADQLSRGSTVEVLGQDFASLHGIWT